MFFIWQNMKRSLEPDTLQNDDAWLHRANTQPPNETWLHRAWYISENYVLYIDVGSVSEGASCVDMKKFGPCTGPVLLDIDYKVSSTVERSVPTKVYQDREMALTSPLVVLKVPLRRYHLGRETIILQRHLAIGHVSAPPLEGDRPRRHESTYSASWNKYSPYELQWMKYIRDPETADRNLPRNSHFVVGVVCLTSG